MVETPTTPVLAGKYTLRRRLGAGGMAEVFLARQARPEGFEKLVVIKRVLPRHAGDEWFSRMFLDEVRTAQLARALMLLTMAASSSSCALSLSLLRAAASTFKGTPGGGGYRGSAPKAPWRCSYSAASSNNSRAAFRRFSGAMGSDVVMGPPCKVVPIWDQYSMQDGTTPQE